MNNLCLRGGIRTTQYGETSVYLFPFPHEGGKDFKHLDDPAFERLLVDHFSFFRGNEMVGKVNGKTVEIRRTRREQRKIMRFKVSFLDITLLEDTKVNDGSKAILFIELPFHDPAAARQADAAQGDSE